MPSLSELLDNAVGPIAGADITDIRNRARRRRRGRRAIAGLAAVVVGVAVLLVWPRVDRSQELHTIERGLFGEPTGMVLVASDGYDGATFVDLDRRVAVRRPLEGERAGDQPFRLQRVDNDLIVGWGEVRAVPLNGGPSTLLARDAVYVPAVEPGTVWLFDYEHLTHAWQIDLDGRVLHDVPVSTYPIRGVAGGILVEPATVIDARTGAKRTLAAGNIETGDALGSKLLWHEPGAQDVHVTDITADTDRTYRLGDGIEVLTARFAPDATRAAIHVGDQIVLLDLGTGTTTKIVDTADLDTSDPYPAMAWSPDGRQLFIIGRGGSDSTAVVRYDGAVERIKVPFGGLNTLQAIPRSDTTPMLRPTIAESAACPPPSVMPSNRTAPCAFRF